MPTREEMWSKLGSSVDVLVIGGGITGCGIARDAARRGLSVALVEMNDLAYGTSSRSSKLVHGGLRYLEQYEFSLVFEAVSERRILMDIAPHLVNPLGFLFPVFQGSRQSLWLINTGMWVYEGLALFRSPKRPRSLKPAQVQAEEPCLRREGLQGAPLYFDCSTDDARLTLETGLDAASAGAVVATWAKLKSFLKDDSGRVCGGVVEDRISGELKEIRANAVINATGPWTDRTLSRSGPREGGPVLRPTKGVHIVVPKARLPVQHAVVCFHPDDGRVLFAIPWEDATYVGTTDTDFDGDPADLAATREDVDYLIRASASYFPEHPLTYADVLSTWAGLRPLIAPPSAEGGVNESSVSREHQILVGRDGLITIAGGKLTTYRRMAGEVVDTAVKMLRLIGRLPDELRAADTEKEPLPGAVGWPEDDDHAAVAKLIAEAGAGAVAADTARLLTDVYGMKGLDIARLAAGNRALAARICPGRPEILAMVDWAVRQELAASVGDFFIRRSRLFYREADQGLGGVDRVAARMGELLGWSDAQREANAEAYRADVAQSRAWRGGVEQAAAR